MKSAAATRPYSQSARAQSAEETHRRIAEAFLARLMEQWFDEITLDRVAEDAGVTVQTVVRRFGGKDGLLSAAAKIFSEQVNAQRAMPTGDVGRVVESVIKDYERTGDAVIRLLALEGRQPALKKVLEFGCGEHRQWIAQALAEPLRKVAGPQRERMLDALVIVTDVYTWKLLRRDMQRSVPAAATAMKRLILATIAEFNAQQ